MAKAVAAPKPPAASNTAAVLRSAVERIERLEDEADNAKAAGRDIYREVKSNGFSPKVLRRLVALRKKEPSVVEEEETLLDQYRGLLGM